MAQTPLAFQSQVFGNIEKTLAANATGTSTTETAFMVNGNSIAGISSFVLPLSLGNPGIFVAGSYALGTLASTGLPFKLRAYGFAKTGASENLTINIYQVPAASISGLTSTSFTGATKIATTGALAVNSTTGCFYSELTLQAVATSGTAVTLQGFQTHLVNEGTLVSPVILTASPSGLYGEGDLNFFVTSTLSVGHAGDTVTLMGLQIESLG
jgi:hypothetical protein